MPFGGTPFDEKNNELAERHLVEKETINLIDNATVVCARKNSQIIGSKLLIKILAGFNDQNR